MSAHPTHLYERLADHTPSGHYIAEQFLTLPPRDELPDYYAFTRLPVALDNIEAKLQRNAYPTMTAVESDFKRMVQNAKDYNAPKSDIYEDAERIRKLVYNYMKSNNPAYDDQNYSSFPTPISQVNVNGGAVGNGVHKEEEMEDGPAPRQASERPKSAVAVKSSEPPPDRRSLAPSATTGDEDAALPAGDLDFNGMSFQEAQQKIITYLLHFADEE